MEVNLKLSLHYRMPFLYGVFMAFVSCGLKFLERCRHDDADSESAAGTGLGCLGLRTIDLPEVSTNHTCDLRSKLAIYS